MTKLDAVACWLGISLLAAMVALAWIAVGYCLYEAWQHVGWRLWPWKKDE